MKNLGSFLMLVFLFAAAPAYATDVTLFGGFQHQGRVTLDSGTTSQLGQAVAQTFDPVNFGVFGFRLGHGRVLGGEHTLAYTPNFISSDRKAVIYNSNLMLQAPFPIARPYGTVGLGGVFTMGDTLIDIGNKFAINYGGGVKVLPAGPVGVQFDVRGYTMPGIEREGTRIEADTLNIFEVSVGVVFSF
jgi:hypothetical protein